MNCAPLLASFSSTLAHKWKWRGRKKLAAAMCMINCTAKIEDLTLTLKKMNGSLPYKKKIEEKTRWSGQPFRTSLSCVYCCSLSLNLSYSLSLSLVSVSLSVSFLSLFIHLSCSLFWVRTLRYILSLGASLYPSLCVVFHAIIYK